MWNKVLNKYELKYDTALLAFFDADISEPTAFRYFMDELDYQQVLPS